MIALFDTHAHLDQADFDADRAAVVARARAAGVRQTLVVGTTVASSRRCIEIAAEFPGLYAAVAIHPNYLGEAASDDWAAIEELSTRSGVAAIGETGLDRHWDFTPFDVQLDYFQRHMRLARQRDLPFIVHMRDCEVDVMECLRREFADGGLLRGVMHSFTGDSAMAAECIALGMHISFAGMVTFKKSTALRECAATIPDDRLLIETDAPYLSPEPMRSVRRNEPAQVRFTAECLARERGTTLETLAELTSENARRLFRVDEPSAA